MERSFRKTYCAMKASTTQACFEIDLKSKSALFWASTLGLYFVASQYLFFLLSQKAWEAVVYKLLCVTDSPLECRDADIT